jgi:hypothetical protein
MGQPIYDPFNKSVTQVNMCIDLCDTFIKRLYIYIYIYMRCDTVTTKTKLFSYFRLDF